MDLQEILKRVSRSFYLSLKFLPPRLRPLLRLAFLTCKAADTIADTEIIPQRQRLERLREYNALLSSPRSMPSAPIKEGDMGGGCNPENLLLQNIASLFEAVGKLSSQEQKLLRKVTTNVIEGMILDLTYFSGGAANKLKAFQSEEELDRYTFLVAGTVGRFWTKALSLHCCFAKYWSWQEQENLGEKFGKGLQLVNILRDLPHDLQRGRCYLPEEKLKALGLLPSDLLKMDPRLRGDDNGGGDDRKEGGNKSEIEKKLYPYYLELINRARIFLLAGKNYVDGMPRYALRLRWSTLLPMQLGLATLNLLEKSPEILNPRKVIKIKRSQVYRMMCTTLMNGCNGK